ncbi:MAG: iron ABC transporter permease [Corynebacterium sp.]|uniref:ABC transporter permease n=1 Tax=Corynebacterium sp. TaxID=1720 RepID=UPI0026DED860|nr:iron ABC transporter permease [Corynebacterium sp.]MDO5668445.1 iron ABC transporter permease [Corynebacterium sp.]
MTTLTAAPGAGVDKQKKATPMRNSRVLLAAVLLIITALIGWPLWGVFRYALSVEGWTVVSSFATSRINRQLLLNTLQLGLSVATLTTVLAFILAFAQARMHFLGRRAIHFLTLLPIVSPPFAVAAATITLFGRSGMITQGIFGYRLDIYGFWGLLFVLTLSYLPLAYMNLLGMLRALDPAHEEAAFSLGANRLRILRTVTLPMLVPGFAGAFLLVFVETISDLSNPLVLGGDFQVLASRAYLAIIGEYNLPGGAAYSMVLLLPAVTLFLLQRYWAERASTVSVSGKPTGRHVAIETPWLKIPALIVAYIVAALVLIIYGAILLGGFVRILGVNNTFTLNNYRYIFTGVGNDAIIDTTLLALIATPIAGLLGVFIAWLVVTRLQRTAGVVDFLGMLGMALPGTVVGIGYLIVYNSSTTVFGIPLAPALAGGGAVFGGAIAIIMVFVAGSSPVGQRNGISALRQIDPALEEASISLGQSEAGTFRRITMPLLRPALLAGLTYAFARSMTSVSAVIFLTTPSQRILTSQIYAEVDRGRFGNAFAFCTILIIIVLLAMLVIHLITRRMEGARQWQAV